MQTCIIYPLMHVVVDVSSHPAADLIRNVACDCILPPTGVKETTGAPELLPAAMGGTNSSTHVCKLN